MTAYKAFRWSGVITVRLRSLRLEGGNDKQDRHRNQINLLTVRHVHDTCLCACTCVFDREA